MSALRPRPTPHPAPLRRTALAVGAALLLAAPAHARRAPADAPAPLARRSEGVAFVENRGQWPDDVLFRADLGGGTAWVTRDGVVFDFYAVEREEPDADALSHEAPEATRRRGHVVAMRFEGARAQRAIGHGRRETYHNYFLGRDPARWTRRVPLYDEVVLEGLYDGVDLRLYSEGAFLRYDLVLAPGADPNRVRLRMEGADGVRVTAGGALSFQTALGPVEHRGLVAYQEGAGGRREAVPGAFRVAADGTVGFSMAGADPARALVLDPLLWATFLGGADADYANAVAVGEAERVVVAGETYGAGFPGTAGPYRTTASTAFVAEFAADGDTLHYATFLGGSALDAAWSLALAPDGAITLAGLTTSADFPATPAAFDTTYNGGEDAFVAQLDPDGTLLQYATFLGGAGHEIARNAEVDSTGAVTVTGQTNSADFPSTPGAFDTTYNGGVDAFVAQLDPDGTLLQYATFFGGSDEDTACDVAVRPDGSTVVVGISNSADMPTTPGAFDTAYAGGKDAFAFGLSAAGDTLRYATFLGGAGGEIARGVALNADGGATLVGRTNSTNFPTTPGAFDRTYNGHPFDAFALRLSAGGDTLRYATFLGGTDDDNARGVVVLPDGSAAIAGRTRSASFPTTPDAFDRSHNGRDDALFARVSPDGSVLSYATFLGGTEVDFAYDLALSASGEAVVVGGTASTDFPTTPDTFDAFHNGGDDAFVARLTFLPPPFALTAVPVNPIVPRGDRLLFDVTLTNGSDQPLVLDLVLDVALDSTIVASRALARDAVFPAQQSQTARFALRVPRVAPLATYEATVRALEGDTTQVGEAAFSFEVVRPSGRAAGRSLSEGDAPDWAVVAVYDDAHGAVEDAAVAEETAAWPNPASDQATVAFVLDAPAAVRLTLYDVLGRAVTVVEAGRLEPAAHRLPLDLSALPAGVYVWRLVAGDRVATGRLTVAR